MGVSRAIQKPTARRRRNHLESSFKIFITEGDASVHTLDGDRILNGGDDLRPVEIQLLIQWSAKRYSREIWSTPRPVPVDYHLGTKFRLSSNFHMALPDGSKIYGLAEVLQVPFGTSLGAHLQHFGKTKTKSEKQTRNRPERGFQSWIVNVGRKTSVLYWLCYSTKCWSNVPSSVWTVPALSMFMKILKNSRRFRRRRAVGFDHAGGAIESNCPSTSKSSRIFQNFHEHMDGTVQTLDGTQYRCKVKVSDCKTVTVIDPEVTLRQDKKSKSNRNPSGAVNTTESICAYWPQWMFDGGHCA